MSQAIFFHAGCPVCVTAEEQLTRAIDPARYTVEAVHLGEHPERIAEAKQAGVNSVPALVLEGQTFHINFGASLSHVEESARA